MANVAEEEGLVLCHQIVHKFLALMERLFYFLKLGKCKFERLEGEFLGWKVTKEGIIVNPLKVTGLSE